jgi:protein dithiol:quinone oxidoreductase
MMAGLIDYRRSLNFAAAVACAALLGFAYFIQYVIGMEPCPLCIVQRAAFLGLGLVFLLAAVHHPRAWGIRVYAGALLLAGGFGAAVAIRHLWLQSLPPELVPACGPGLAYMMEVFPLLEVIQAVLRGSGECAQVEKILGVTIPAWTLTGYIGLTAAGLLINWRRRA